MQGQVTWATKRRQMTNVHCCQSSRWDWIWQLTRDVSSPVPTASAAPQSSVPHCASLSSAVSSGPKSEWKEPLL